MITGKTDSERLRDDPPVDAATGGTATKAGDRPVPDPEAELPLDVVFDILKNQRRRLVLRYLIEVTPTTTLSDLAEHIAALENGKSEDSLTSSERKRVYVCLYQCHLPKLDDAGVVEFENDRGTVELAGNTDQLTPYLDLGEDDPMTEWPKYYAVLAVIGGGLFVAQQLLYPSPVLSGVIMGVLMGLFINLALEHAYNRGILSSGGDRPVGDAEPT